VLVIFLQVCGVSVSNSKIDAVITAGCAVLILLGYVTDDTKQANSLDDEEKTQDEIKKTEK
jgi:uncharacterized membrane protein